LGLHEFSFLIFWNVSFTNVINFWFISFCRNSFWIKETLVKNLSIVILGSIESIMNRRLFLLNKVDFIWSICSSHWVWRIRFSLFKSAYSLYRGVRSMQSKLAIIPFPSYMRIRSCLVVSFITLLWCIKFWSWFSLSILHYIFWGVFLLLMRVTCISLISNMNRSFWRRGRGFSIRRPLSMRDKYFRVLFCLLLALLISWLSIFSTHRILSVFVLKLIVYWFPSILPWRWGDRLIVNNSNFWRVTLNSLSSLLVNHRNPWLII